MLLLLLLSGLQSMWYISLHLFYFISLDHVEISMHGFWEDWPPQYYNFFLKTGIFWLNFSFFLSFFLLRCICISFLLSSFVTGKQNKTNKKPSQPTLSVFGMLVSTLICILHCLFSYLNKIKMLQVNVLHSVAEFTYKHLIYSLQY